MILGQLSVFMFQMLLSPNEESMDSGDSIAKSLAWQNQELRRKLEEEQESYKLKLQSYRSGKQKQSQLAQQSQAEVMNSFLS